MGQFLNPQARSIEEYQGFLLEVLQAEAEINDGRAIITDNDYYYKNMLQIQFLKMLTFIEFLKNSIIKIGKTKTK